MTTTRRFRGPRHLPLTLSLACLAVLTSSTACGSDGGDDRDRGDRPAAISAGDPADPAGTVTSTAGTVTSADGSISAAGAWVRVAIRPAGSDEPGAPPVNSAGYLVLAGTPRAAADALVTVETAVSDTAELHTVSMSRRRHADAGRGLDPASPPAAGPVLRPGGYHIITAPIRARRSRGRSPPFPPYELVRRDRVWPSVRRVLAKVLSHGLLVAFDQE
jgi:copper(I)-binding protein